ncbi:hypothetical protein CASFOL_004324 [Castilleja foliolosa]|uniref:Uncharacterized protein n=1 Tax=Castilleja foliolosa TaxID=1961234 RepID=A0ABD3EC71_9LAMI
MLEKTVAGWTAATGEIGLQETMLQLGLGGGVGPESYPERPDQPAYVQLQFPPEVDFPFSALLETGRFAFLPGTESRKNEQRNVNGWDDDLMQYSKTDKWNLQNRSNLKRARRMDAMFKSISK